MDRRIKSFGALVGEWSTVGQHPLLPGTLHGHATFDWIEDGAFLRWRSDVDEEGVPTGTAIIGCDDASDICSMVYFDERGVSRVYQTTFAGDEWKFWRDAPEFRQRYTATVSPTSIQLAGELSEDDSTWAADLAETYTRLRGSEIPAAR